MTTTHSLNKARVLMLILERLLEEWRAAEKRERDEVKRAMVLV